MVGTWIGVALRNPDALLAIRLWRPGYFCASDHPGTRRWRSRCAADGRVLVVCRSATRGEARFSFSYGHDFSAPTPTTRSLADLLADGVGQSPVPLGPITGVAEAAI